MSQLDAYLRKTIDLPGLARTLDSLSTQERIAAVTSLGRSAQARLFEAAERELLLDQLVPASTASGSVIVHSGRNSLPVFTRFEKRFTRGDSEGELWGYNHSAVSPLVGPGYFVAYRDASGITWFDYTRLPSRPLADGPALRDNRSGLSAPVFGGLRDEVRRVSRNTVIGRASRDGKPMDAWFLLTAAN